LAVSAQENSRKPLASVQENPREPFQVEAPAEFGNSFITLEFPAEVPKGQRLIMQHVSLKVTNDSRSVGNASCTFFVSLQLDDDRSLFRELVRVSDESHDDLPQAVRELFPCAPGQRVQSILAPYLWVWGFSFSLLPSLGVAPPSGGHLDGRGLGGFYSLAV